MVSAKLSSFDTANNTIYVISSVISPRRFSCIQKITENRKSLVYSSRNDWKSRKHSQELHTKLDIFDPGSKEFRHQYTLMRHLPTHTDERNFKCEACGKAFRQLSTLSQHKAIHSDARPYVCEFCKKTFNRSVVSNHSTNSIANFPNFQVHFRVISFFVPVQLSVQLSFISNFISRHSNEPHFRQKLKL